MRKLLPLSLLLLAALGCQYTVFGINLSATTATDAPPPTLAIPTFPAVPTFPPPPTALESPVPSVTPTYTPGEFAGTYKNMFEISAFHPCGAPQDEVYWLGAGNIPGFWNRYQALGGQGTEVFLRFTGELSPPSPLGYGHMNGYQREINILELYELSLDGKCP